MDPSDELELLARHVPFFRFDARELFFPTAVDSYIATSALVLGGNEVLIPGEVTPEALTGDLGTGCYLQFVSDHDRRSVVRDEAKRLAGKLLGPRLGRVGFFGRMLDALFLLSVAIRPTTPRLTTVAASLKAERYDLHAQPVCYGRVAEVGEWLVLHYTFFYVMNDWRSGYRGLNDHEADWEQAWVFCDPADREPVWVVASSHENIGADLRRHWNDTELLRDDDHPILYVGAGSHALFFRPGDYVSRIDIPALRWLLRVRRWSRRALRIRDDVSERGLGPALGVPFVDAAPGDGREIDRWDLHLLDDHRSCFGSFRGLWGLDTGDPINSERGPAGPKFGRDGEIRHSWADPVGYAGLHGTSPPSLADPELSLARISSSLASIEAEIERASELMPLVAQAADGAGGGGQGAVALAERLTWLRRQQVELRDLRHRLERGEVSGKGIRDHLHDPAVPIAPPKETGWLLAIWASISVPLLMLAVAAPMVLRNLRVLWPLVGTMAGFSLLEQLVRRRFNAVFRLAVLYFAVAVFFGFVSVVTISLYAFGAVLGLAAVLLFVSNLGELQAVRRRAELTGDDDRV